MVGAATPWYRVASSDLSSSRGDEPTESANSAERPHPSHLVALALAPVVQTVDSAIHRINLYPLDSAIGSPNIYPMDSDISVG